MNDSRPISRRGFLCRTGALALASQAVRCWGNPIPETIIDIHQHTQYSGRSNAQLFAHQKALGITRTILLPAGSRFGLDAGCGGNETVLQLAREHPREFLFFANEVADMPEAPAVIERYLKMGAVGIGEQKFRVESDSKHIERIAELAREYDVPVLLHFQFGAYNTHLGRFHKILEKFPTVNFIGHAQTWWGHIDKDHDETVMYPKTPVTRGGITDRYLSDYPNMHGDLSAGSGLNSLLRDEEHARGFLERHQDQLLFGSDCNDTLGRGLGCQGAQILEALRRLAGPNALGKILHGNAARLLKFRP